jgi:hypothetical protein
LKEGQTTQWPEERAQKDKKSLKIPKEVIRNRKSKKGRQLNGQKKEDKRSRRD